MTRIINIEAPPPTPALRDVPVGAIFRASLYPDEPREVMIRVDQPTSGVVVVVPREGLAPRFEALSPGFYLFGFQRLRARLSVTPREPEQIDL